MKSSLTPSDVADIVFELKAYIWDELVNKYSIPIGVADLVSLRVGDLIKEELSEEHGQS